MSVTLSRPEHPVAMVTGGNGGIGLGICRELVRLGYRVSILDVREEPAEVMAELREAAGDESFVMHTQGSVADLDDDRRFLDATLEAWGRVDLLVNNAGVAPLERNDIMVATPESFDRVLSINLRGPYFLTQMVANQMVAQRDRDLEAAGLSLKEAFGTTHFGTIVNISSISADVVSINRGEYCMSKAGVHMASQLWATRLAPEGILVYEVRPGLTLTDMTAGSKEKYDKLLEEGISPIPRWGQPRDTGSVVGMLAEGRAPYSTGDLINVDGGMHMKRL